MITFTEKKNATFQTEWYLFLTFFLYVCDDFVMGGDLYVSQRMIYSIKCTAMLSSSVLPQVHTRSERNAVNEKFVDI